MTSVRYIPLVFGLLVACGDEVTLVDTHASTSLTYDCGELQSLARSTAEQAVVKEHALRIARRAAARADTALLARLTSAYEDPDGTVLEALVIGDICEHGIPIEEPPPAPVFPEAGTEARDFTLRQLTLEPPYNDGPSVTLSDQQGSVVVLDVFGTWCPPCVRKYPAMAELARDYVDEGVRFFGILLNDKPARAAEWFREHGGMAYPFLLESGSDVEATWALHGAPRMFVIDQRGIIIERCIGCGVGPLSPDSLPVLLDSLLNADSDSRLTSADS